MSSEAADQNLWRDTVHVWRDALRRGLTPFVEGTMACDAGADWRTHEVWLHPGPLDNSALLRLLDIKWPRIFSRHLPQAERWWFTLLREFRHKDAHDKPITEDELLRALDIGALLLDAVGARPEAKLLRVRYDERQAARQRKPPETAEVAEKTLFGPPHPPKHSDQREDLDREEVICRIRQVFGDGTPRGREVAIVELAREFGYQRTGSKIREEIDNSLRTAALRGILSNEGGVLRIFAQSIESHDRPFLKKQFLASLAGRQWTDRDEAIRGFARWLGFRRTGPTIDETARSLIKGLIQEGRIESDHDRIRRAP